MLRIVFVLKRKSNSYLKLFNMKTYKSKLGLELIIPLVVVFVAVLVLTSSNEPWWLGFVILSPIMAFILHLFKTTDYTIEGNMLKVRAGFLFNKRIEIASIKKIIETRNPLSAPATSLDRIELLYNTFDNVLISPKLKADFIAHLKAINPNIEVVLKEK